MRFNYIIITINILILVIIFIIYRKNKYQYGLVPIVSSIDKKKYLVRKENNSKQAANILSKFDHIQFKIFDSKAHKVLNKKNCEIIPTGDDVFFNAILNCKGVICGAGFELPSEVLYLKKELYVIPIGNQYEQKCNAQALIDMGIDSFHKLESKNLKKDIWYENIIANKKGLF